MIFTERNLAFCWCIHPEFTGYFRDLFSLPVQGADNNRVFPVPGGNVKRKRISRAVFLQRIFPALKSENQLHCSRNTVIQKLSGKSFFAAIGGIDSIPERKRSIQKQFQRRHRLFYRVKCNMIELDTSRRFHFAEYVDFTILLRLECHGLRLPCIERIMPCAGSGNCLAVHQGNYAEPDCALCITMSPVASSARFIPKLIILSAFDCNSTLPR